MQLLFEKLARWTDLAVAAEAFHTFTCNRTTAARGRKLPPQLMQHYEIRGVATFLLGARQYFQLEPQQLQSVSRVHGSSSSHTSTIASTFRMVHGTSEPAASVELQLSVVEGNGPVRGNKQATKNYYRSSKTVSRVLKRKLYYRYHCREFPSKFFMNSSSDTTIVEAPV